MVVAEYCEYTKCYLTVHCTIVSFVLSEFYFLFQSFSSFFKEKIILALYKKLRAPLKSEGFRVFFLINKVQGRKEKRILGLTCTGSRARPLPASVHYISTFLGLGYSPCVYLCSA